MEDYYPAELPVILHAWAELHGGKPSDEVQITDPMTFFGTGGECVDS